MKIFDSFNHHSREVGMTYFQHMRFALWLAWRLFCTAFLSIIHAFFPFLFTTNTSTTVRNLNDLFNQRVYKNGK